jgi:hypothetical protein
MLSRSTALRIGPVRASARRPPSRLASTGWRLSFNRPPAGLPRAERSGGLLTDGTVRGPVATDGFNSEVRLSTCLVQVAPESVGAECVSSLGPAIANGDCRLADAGAAVLEQLKSGTPQNAPIGRRRTEAYSPRPRHSSHMWPSRMKLQVRGSR